MPLTTSQCSSFTVQLNHALPSWAATKGVKLSDIETQQQRGASVLADVQARTAQGELPIFQLPTSLFDSDFADIERIEKLFAPLKTILVLGTGGSSLGGKTLCALTETPIQSLTRRVLFFDNVDPATFTALWPQLDWATTGVIAISKSGTTSETMCQLIAVLQHMQQVLSAAQIRNQLIVVTEPGARPMRALAEQYGLVTLDHHPNVGGRYSVLSIVGLLPAALAGVNVRQVRSGALDYLEHYKNSGTSHPAVTGASLLVALSHIGVNQHVVMPYIDRLNMLSIWYRQLWAESIGKQGVGTTPINALGTVDQHSQLQLYLDGPKDKFFTVMTSDVKHEGERMMKETFHHAGIDALMGHTMGDLLVAEQQATMQTLINQSCPLRHISLSAVNEKTLGALLQHWMLETVIAAGLWSINAFDQPAVEESKILTKQYLKDMRHAA